MAFFGWQSGKGLPDGGKVRPVAELCGPLPSFTLKEFYADELVDPD